MAQESNERRDAHQVISREVTPEMIVAGLGVLSESLPALSSGEASGPDLVALIFGAMRAEQTRSHST